MFEVTSCWRMTSEEMTYNKFDDVNKNDRSKMDGETIKIRDLWYNILQ